MITHASMCYIVNDVDYLPGVRIDMGKEPVLIVLHLHGVAIMVYICEPYFIIFWQARLLT